MNATHSVGLAVTCRSLSAYVSHFLIPCNVYRLCTGELSEGSGRALLGTMQCHFTTVHTLIYPLLGGIQVQIKLILLAAQSCRRPR